MTEVDCRRERGLLRVAFAALAVLFAVNAGELEAQVPVTGPVPIDSIRVTGNVRLDSDVILQQFPIKVGDEITILQIRDATKAMMASGQYRDVIIRALGEADEPTVLVIEVDEHPLVRDVRILGLQNASAGSVRDSAGLADDIPYAPQRVALARSVILDELAKKGIPFAAIEDRLVEVPDRDNTFDLVIEVEEGNRVTIAGFEIAGNENVPSSAILGAMQTRAEGFWWFQPGTYERLAYEQDLAVQIPQEFYNRGYLDVEILGDTLIIDPETGKARIQIQIDEGEQYRIARFSIDGNSGISDEDLEIYFRPERGGILSSLGIGGGDVEEAQQRGEVFDQGELMAAVSRVENAYSTRGYLWAAVRPSVEKTVADDEAAVEVTIQIQEGPLATIGSINIEGNDYTHDWVIRDKILLLPGETFNMSRVLQSYQNIQSLGFFVAPGPTPNIDPDPERGVVDLTFRVEETQTGAINFGSSVGGGVGVAGFIGYDQPNLFGQAKVGSVRWDFGRFVNNFTLRYSDPALFRSRISGSISLFNSRDRFIRFNTGNRRRIGGGLRFGFPLPNDPRARFFVGYSLSRTKYNLRSGVDDTSLFGLDDGIQSQASLGVLRSTLNHPIFPTQGGEQRLDTELNGGVLGGDGNFQKVTGQMRWWVPIGTLGDPSTGSAPILAAGLSVKGGAIFGDPSRFPFERFWMGGVQFGERLRGYDETTVTPLGFFPEGSDAVRDVERLGDAFAVVSAEMALTLGPAFRFTSFFDAGNVWADPSEVDPSRLFKGAGFGLTLQSPFGPLGIDYAYGFDRDIPGWQLHFQFGQGGF